MLFTREKEVETGVETRENRRNREYSILQFGEDQGHRRGGTHTHARTEAATYVIESKRVVIVMGHEVSILHAMQITLDLATPKSIGRPHIGLGVELKYSKFTDINHSLGWSGL